MISNKKPVTLVNRLERAHTKKGKKNFYVYIKEKMPLKTYLAHMNKPFHICIRGGKYMQSCVSALLV